MWQLSDLLEWRKWHVMAPIFHILIFINWLQLSLIIVPKWVIHDSSMFNLFCYAINNFTVEHLARWPFSLYINLFTLLVPLFGRNCSFLCNHMHRSHGSMSKCCFGNGPRHCPLYQWKCCLPHHGFLAYSLKYLLYLNADYNKFYKT
jgi:hypothetical protein